MTRIDPAEEPICVQDEIDALQSSYEARGLHLNAYADDEEIFIDGIERDRANHSTKGLGAEAMTALCAIADRHALPIELSRMACDDGLVAYYGRFGFTDDPREGNPDLVAMRREIREPRHNGDVV